MNIEAFVVDLRENVRQFGVNLNNLEGRYTERTREEWMEMFLRWAEWQTDMHEEYWGKSLNVIRTTQVMTETDMGDKLYAYSDDLAGDWIVEVCYHFSEKNHPDELERFPTKEEAFEFMQSFEYSSYRRK